VTTKAKTVRASRSKRRLSLPIGTKVEAWVLSQQMPGHFQYVVGNIVDKVCGHEAYLLNLGTSTDSCVWVARDMILETGASDGTNA
jgi:hypothetical protein